jgi:hypothetical protein
MLRRASILECRRGFRFSNVAEGVATMREQRLFNQDVATYGGLCALASFDIAELKVKGFVAN